MRKEILDQLKSIGVEKHKKFVLKLSPNLKEEQVLGVRIPVLREIAKDLAKKDFIGYINELPKDMYFEEKMIYGLILGYCKMPWEEWQKMTRDFVKIIEDWSVCDSCTMTMKMKKKDMEKGWEFCKEFLNKEGEFQRRFAIIFILTNYITKEYIEESLKILNEIDQEDYYVMMAVAWTLSLAFIRFPGETRLVLGSDKLPMVTKKKAIQKIRESIRVAKEDKEDVLNFIQ